MTEKRMEHDDRVLAAAEEYVNRRLRIKHPDGKSDGKRWYPSDAETQECCSGIRSPSAAHPWSYMLHCRTLGHVARLFGVEEAEVRKVARVFRLVDGVVRRRQ